MKYIYTLSLIIMLAFQGYLFGQAGTIDSDFGDGGGALYRDAGYRPEVRSILLVENDDIITCGHRQNGFGSQLQMLGFHTDGSVNEDFGGTNLFGNPTWGYPGIINTDFANLDWEHISAAVLQSDGKIVVSGYAGINFDWLIARYKADGSVDSTFHFDGYISEDEGGFELAASIGVTASNNILVSGIVNSKITTRQYQPDGSLDSGFGINGSRQVNLENISGGDMAISHDGKIYLCGSQSQSNVYKLIVIRLLANGQLDNSFGANGISEITMPSFPSSIVKVAVLSDGSAILVADDLSNFGNNSNLLVCKLKMNGSLDGNFGLNGSASYALGDFVTPNAIALQSNGKILVAGRLVDAGVADMFVAKFYADGSFDPDFGTNGVAISGFATDLSNNSAIAYSLKQQPDGKIIVGGFVKQTGLQHAAIVRFNNEVDSMYSSIYDATNVNQLNIYPNPVMDDIHIEMQSDLWSAIKIYDNIGNQLYSSLLSKGKIN